MVWIHGGGFVEGSGMYWDGTRLAKKGVVVVAINYRLEALGFASLGNNIMPGNYGMMDQVLALEWVQHNVRAFGGNSKQVTLFGASAGSSSISLHLVSPLSNGLFHRAIMQSGSYYSTWGVERKKALTSLKEGTKKIAYSLGCQKFNANDSGTHGKPSDESKVILDCLRKVDANKIIRQSRIVIANATDTLFTFLPTVEKTFGFLPDYPETMIDAGTFHNVDQISGFDSGEAAHIINQAFPKATGLSRDEFKYGIQKVFTWCSFKQEDLIIDRITEFYIRNVSDPKIILQRYFTATNDLLKMPILLQLRNILQHQNSPANHWLYQLDYIPSTDKLPKYLGLPHYQELVLVFYSDANTTIFTNNGFDTHLSPKDIKMADRVQGIWTHFARTGSPMKSITPMSIRKGAISGPSSSSQSTDWPKYTLKDTWLAHLNSNISLQSYFPKSALDLYKEFLRFINT